jgi:hypothetical protein
VQARTKDAEKAAAAALLQAEQEREGEEEMLQFVANYRRHQDGQRQRAVQTRETCHDAAVTAKAKVEVKRARLVAQQEAWQARQAELKDAGANSIQAIQAELAAKREESRKARAMAQLDAKQRYDARCQQPNQQQQQQKEKEKKNSPARVVAGRRGRKGRGSGGAKKQQQQRRQRQQPPRVAMESISASVDNTTAFT